MVLESGNSYLPVWYLMRAHFLAHREQSFHYNLTCQNGWGREFSWSLPLPPLPALLLVFLRSRAPIPWLTPQIHILGTVSRSPVWVAGTLLLEPSLPLPKPALAGIWSQKLGMEPPGWKPTKGLFCKILTIYEGPWPKELLRTHLLIQSLVRLGFQLMNFRRMHTFRQFDKVFGKCKIIFWMFHSKRILLSLEMDHKDHLAQFLILQVVVQKPKNWPNLVTGYIRKKAPEPLFCMMRVGVKWKIPDRSCWCRFHFVKSTLYCLNLGPILIPQSQAHIQGLQLTRWRISWLLNYC